MGTPFKMKGSPMARNFGAPFKDNDKVAGGKKSTEKIWDDANAEYLEQGSKAESEIKEKAQTKVNEAVKFNKSRANYFKHVASVAPTANQSAESKGKLIDPNDPDVRHDDIIIDTYAGKVNSSKQARKKKK